MGLPQITQVMDDHDFVLKPMMILGDWRSPLLRDLYLHIYIFCIYHHPEVDGNDGIHWNMA